MNVLYHYDGIVDDETDRDSQRHQGKVIETETKQIHHRGRAEQCQRHRDAGNDRCPEIAQEQQYHQYHQHDGQSQGELNVPYRGANRAGAVLLHLDIDGRRDVPDQPRQQLLDLIDSLDDIGAGLLEHDQQNATFAVLE